MVPMSTVIVIVINLLLGLVIPAALYMIMKNRFGANRVAFLIGCAVMLVFAFMLESTIHSIVLNSSLGKVINGNIWIYAVYGASMAAIFEETGRYIAFSSLLKKYRDNDSTALMCGAGHGGFEAFYILAVTAVNNLTFASMINGGNSEMLTAGLSGDALARVEAAIVQMTESSWGIFLLSPIERIAAVILHISLSVLVWFAVKQGKKGFFGLALLLHFLLDFVAVMANELLSGLGTAGVLVTEAAVWIMALLSAVVALKIWRKYAFQSE